VEADPDFPLLLDLGTGLSRLAASAPLPSPFRATALVSHLHFDHVQGLPFFPPTDAPGSIIDIYGPAQDDVSLGEAFSHFIRPPYFPIPLSRFGAGISFREVLEDEFSLGRATVKVRPVPHLGPTVGYRIDCDGASVAYVSDHQVPPDQTSVAPSVLELCEGVDLLIHDAQYTRAEFPRKALWGHSTVDYAVLVAKEAGARRLCLFHHDPARTDDQLDALVVAARAAVGNGLEDVFAASEGLTVELPARGTRRN
jgi:phosphoribosyl 1,2-cyclic phosphodiesterase